jgi:hypothetical protein
MPSAITVFPLPGGPYRKIALLAWTELIEHALADDEM